MKKRIFALILLALGVFLGVVLFRSTTTSESAFMRKHPFRLGLDLSGGSYLLYKADTSTLPPDQSVADAMDALRDVIERRVNLFGVSEPIVEVQNTNVGSVKEHRLAVELPGITDISKAIETIGQTPFLEFRIQSDAPMKATVDASGKAVLDATPQFVATGLNGKYLKRAQLIFNPNTGTPEVSLVFNSDGATLFEKITKENTGKVLAIYLDGQVISAPVIREAISGGTAQITGNFTAEEAKALVGRLNSGALPVPISLISTQTVGATLGADAVHAGAHAALLGFIIVALFLIIWYRLPGVVAVLALSLYVIITLFLYRFIPVTLTASGIAGFIISIGMAVDANILIFERFREERARGRSVREALEYGFSRAWLSIRDANIASLLIALTLFWFGTALMKGFALTFGLGVIISLFSAVVLTRVFLRALPTMESSRVGRFLYTSGLRVK